MSAAAIQLAILVLEEAIKLEPQIAAELQQLFTKADATPEDFAALRAKVAKRYADYVPDSVLPK